MKRLLSFVLSAALIVSGTYAANSMHISADEASSGVGSSATPQTELDPASSPQITEEPGAVPDDTPQVSGQPTAKPGDAPQAVSYTHLTRDSSASKKNICKIEASPKTGWRFCICLIM